MAFLGGLFGGGPSAPKYNMSPEYRDLTFGQVYPSLTKYIQQGGIKQDTAGLERGAQEDIAGQYGNAMTSLRSLLPYGNPGAMGRAGLGMATSQAQETSRATTGIRSGAEANRIQSLMSLLGMAGGMQDPNMTQYQADLQKYGADIQKYGSEAGLWGGIIGLGATPLLGPAGGAGMGLLNGGGGGGTSDVYGKFGQGAKNLGGNLTTNYQLQRRQPIW